MTDAFITKIEKMTDEALANLRSNLVTRQEKLRVSFSRSRSVKHGEQYRDVSKKLSDVKREIQARARK